MCRGLEVEVNLAAGQFNYVKPKQGSNDQESRIAYREDFNGEMADDIPGIA